MEYLFTERAHLMCPHMCFGIALVTRREFDPPRIRETVEDLSEAHPFLRALLGYEEKGDRYFYDVGEESKTEVFIYDEEIEGLDSREILLEYDRITGKDFDLFKEGMLKCAAWKGGGKTVFLLVFHHLLADGRGALSLAGELADLYVSGKRPQPVEEKLIASAGDFPKDSGLPFLTRLLVDRVNRSWKREKKRLSCEEYHRLADAFVRSDPVRHEMSVMGKEEVAALAGRCRKEGVTVKDYLLAKVFLEEKARRIVIARDLRDRLRCFRPGALGNYATAFSVQGIREKSDLYAAARQVHDRIRRIEESPASLYLILQCYAALEPGLLDAAMMAARGRFDSRTAAFIGRNFFHMDRAEGISVTNLGRMESPVIEDACFIPPASPAMKKTTGVLTMNGRMRLCTSQR